MLSRHFCIVAGVTVIFIVVLFAMIDLKPRARVISWESLTNSAFETRVAYRESSLWFYRSTCLHLLYAQFVIIMVADVVLRSGGSGKRTRMFWIVSVVAAAIILGATIFPTFAGLDPGEAAQLIIVLSMVSTILNTLLLGPSLLYVKTKAS